jgi:hypothetical protein
LERALITGKLLTVITIVFVAGQLPVMPVKVYVVVMVGETEMDALLFPLGFQV